MNGIEHTLAYITTLLICISICVAIVKYRTKKPKNTRVFTTKGSIKRAIIEDISEKTASLHIDNLNRELKKNGRGYRALYNENTLYYLQAYYQDKGVFIFIDDNAKDKEGTNLTKFYIANSLKELDFLITEIT